MKKIIFVDFDGTLFDTKRFIKEMAEIFRVDGGINFFETFPQNSLGFYSYYEHLLCIPAKQARVRTKKRLKEFFVGCSKFVFADVSNFLNSMEFCRGSKVVLISRGEKTYQSRKIYMAFKQFFDSIDKVFVIESKFKAYCMEELIKSYSAHAGSGNEVFLLDNSLPELIHAKNHLPAINTIHIDRYGATRDSGKADFFVRSLADATKIIRSSG